MEEICALPQELMGQCMYTIQARERQVSAVPDRPPITIPRENTYDTAATSTVRCFGERERARQMETLMVMWSRRFVCRSLVAEILSLADPDGSPCFYEAAQILDERSQLRSYTPIQWALQTETRMVPYALTYLAFHLGWCSDDRTHALPPTTSPYHLPAPRELCHSETRIFRVYTNHPNLLLYNERFGSLYSLVRIEWRKPIEHRPILNIGGIQGPTGEARVQNGKPQEPFSSGETSVDTGAA